MNGSILVRQCLVGFMLVSVVFSASCIDRAPGPLSLREIRQQIIGKWYVSNESGKRYKTSEFLPDGQVIDRIFAPDGTPGPLMMGRYVIPSTDLIQFTTGYFT